jgi:hypothetical protein
MEGALAQRDGLAGAERSVRGLGAHGGQDGACRQDGEPRDSGVQLQLTGRADRGVRRGRHQKSLVSKMARDATRPAADPRTPRGPAATPPESPPGGVAARPR